MTCVLLNVVKLIRFSLSMAGSQKSGKAKQTPIVRESAIDFNADTVGLTNFQAMKYSTG